MQRLGHVRIADPHYFGYLLVSKTLRSEHETLALLGGELPHGCMKPAEVLLVKDRLFRRGAGITAQVAELIPEVRVHSENILLALELVNRQIVSNPENPGTDVLNRLSAL